jgi:hypothetical protein
MEIALKVPEKHFCKSSWIPLNEMKYYAGMQP